MSFRFLLLCSLAAGCGESHVSDADGAMADGGFADSDLPDAAVLDVGLDTTPVPTSCTGELTTTDGEPCFCQGAFVVDGDVAYRTSYDLEVHDVSGSSVVNTGTTPQSRPGSEGALVLAAGHLFVGGWGLEVFDVSDRMLPRSVATSDFDGTVSDLRVVDSTLWVAIAEAEIGLLRSYDVSNPAEPRELTSISLEGDPGSLVAWGSDRLVVIEARRFGEDGPDTATIIDISSRPRVETRIDLEGDAVLRRRAAIAGSTLYVAGTEPALQLVDLEAERIVSTLAAPERSSGGLGITVSGGLAFISGWQIQVADVSDTASPRWIGQLTAPSDVHHVERRGDTLFIGTGSYLGKIPLDCR